MLSIGDEPKTNKQKTHKMKKEFKFIAVQSLQLANSYGTLKEEDNIQLNVSVGINSEDYGWFEFYDVESGGEEWYAEGGLWFENKELVSYDGVFCLPMFILDKLEENGYNVESMRESLKD